MPVIAVWQQYFKRTPQQRRMSTLSRGFPPQGSECYWDLTAQLLSHFPNSGCLFAARQLRALDSSLFFHRKSACFVKKWNATKQGVFHTRSAQERESFWFVADAWIFFFFPQRAKSHTCFIVLNWHSCVDAVSLFADRFMLLRDCCLESWVLSLQSNDNLNMPP